MPAPRCLLTALSSARECPTAQSPESLRGIRCRDAQIIDPSTSHIFSEGTEEPVKVREAGDGVFECEYYPVVPGKYVVTITWGGYAIPRR